MKSHVMAVILLFFCGIVYAETYNWSQWKGPDQNGISREQLSNPEVLKEKLKVNWKINVGQGYSNVSIKDDYLYTLGYNEDTMSNTLYCISIADGKTVWEYSVKAVKGKYEGPKGTPVIDDGLVYTLSQDGTFLCNDAATGAVKWKKQIVDELGAKVLMWKLSSSVLIEGDMAIVNALKSGIALNKKTGAVIWKSDSGKGNYATPVSFKKDNKPYLAIYGNEHLYGVHANSGKVAWSYPWETKYTIIGADPVIFDRWVFISSGYNAGCALIDISRDKPVEVWRNKDMSTHFSTAIVIDRNIYGIDGNAGTDAELKCMDSKNGKVKWSHELGFGSIIATQGHFIMLNEHGNLHIIKIDPEKYREVSKVELPKAKGLYWTAPVLCRSTLYVRTDEGEILSIDLSGKK